MMSKWTHCTYIVFIWKILYSLVTWEFVTLFHGNIAEMICGNKMPARCNRWFLLQILLLAQHVSGTIVPIIRSSRVLYKWLLPVIFGAWFSSFRYGVELRVVFPVCGLRIFIADLIAFSTCFGHHYAHHQEFESIIQVVAACHIWCLVFKLSVWCGAAT